MVLLNFSFVCKASLPQVWSYFSRFENIAQWDPNVRSAKLAKDAPGVIGSKFDLVTIWKGKESDITYQMIEYQENKMIKVIGKNAMITAVDQIDFKQMGNGTKITYTADITLNHIFCLATPFIKSDLRVLAEQAEKGMKDKCAELFGA